jgi:hypothetical protein
MLTVPGSWCDNSKAEPSDAMIQAACNGMIEVSVDAAEYAGV